MVWLCTSRVLRKRNICLWCSSPSWRPRDSRVLPESPRSCRFFFYFHPHKIMGEAEVHLLRQENWISLAGDDGDFGTGPDTVSPRSRA